MYRSKISTRALRYSGGMFRRDADLPPPAGLIIAEFTSGQDALEFARSKGSLYTVTPGINHVFAVRVKESAAVPSQADRSCAAPQVPGAAHGVRTFRGRPLEYTRVDPLDPRRSEEPICDNE